MASPIARTAAAVPDKSEWASTGSPCGDLTLTDFDTAQRERENTAQQISVIGFTKRPSQAESADAQGHDRREGITSAATGFASFSPSSAGINSTFRKRSPGTALTVPGPDQCRGAGRAHRSGQSNTAVQRLLHLRDTALHEDNLLSSVGGVWRFIQATCAGSSH